MKIRLLLTIVFLIPTLFHSQDFSDSWEGHFSYLNINDVSAGLTKMYGAAENAIFTYDFETMEMEKLSTIHGLLGETISSIKYIEENGILLVGYENGLMQVYIESSREFITVVDIFDKPTIPPDDKRINHFNVYNGFAYISTGYGISLYDINAFEFGDTYFIGANGAQMNINQTAVLGEYIYVASEIGIRKALVDSPNLVDFEQWQQINNLNWVGVEVIGDKIYVATTNNRIYELIGNSIVLKSTYDHLIKDLREVEGRLLVTTRREAYVYDTTTDFTPMAQTVNTTEFNVEFTSATLNANDELFIGTWDNFNASPSRTGFGILKTTISDTSVFEEIHPSSPMSNKGFSIKAVDNNVWMTYGDYTNTFNPFPLRKRGFSHLEGEEWVNVPYSSVFNAVNLNTINVNPLNLNQVYISSFVHGLVEVVDDEPTVLYSLDNSSFQSQHPTITDIRNAASVVDKDGVLWCTNAKTTSPLKSFNLSSGEWKSYDFSAIILNASSTEFGYGSMDVGNNGVKWIGGYKLGIIGYDSDNNLLKNIRGQEKNMPSPSVKAVAVDKSDTVWIGTINGLRVIYNSSEFFNDSDFRLSEIIVLDNGEASEVLFQQYITDIEVDGSNNKWVGTLGTGLYYFSSDGQETIYHFTKDNSPLPTNDIVDVSLDEINGVVYVATGKGMVSFRSDTSKPEETLNNAYVYPNPVRPTFNITEDKVKIKGLTDNVNIKITDIEGNLVTEAESRTNSKFKGYNLEVDGGTALWNGKNMSDRVVASGVYLVMISDLESFETKVLKVMVVR